MSFLKLKLIKKSKNLILLTIPLYSRAIFFLFTIIIAALIVFDGKLTVIPFLLFLIFFLSGCYKESWSFDSSKNIVIYGYGFIFLYKKTVIDFSLIEEFKIESFIKGSLTKKPDQIENGKKKIFQTEYYKLSLFNNEYGEMTLDTVKGVSKEQLYENAEIIAGFCKKKLQKD